MRVVAADQPSRRALLRVVEVAAQRDRSVLAVAGQRQRPRGAQAVRAMRPTAVLAAAR
jgi:hypothetical protein